MTIEIEPQSPGHQAFLEVRRERLAQLTAFLDREFPDPTEVVLEIGCGHGHYLTAYAEQHPEANCVGIDLVSKRIRKGCQKRDKRTLPHLHFIKAEVTEFMAVWPKRLSLERVFILFPDPWPKKRHTKNRIIQTALLDIIGEHAHPGTALHFRTDHEGAFEWGEEVIRSHEGWECPDDAVWPFENPSFFQDLFASYQSLTAIYSG